MNSIIIAFTATAIFFVGCDDLKFGNSFLDKPLGTDNTIDTVFSNRKYAEQALAEAYHSLPDYLPQDGRLGWSTLETLTDLGDNVKDGSSGGYYTGQVTSSSGTGLPIRLTPGGDESAYTGPIYGIRKAWIFIENIDRVIDMTIEEKNIRKAEAKMIIAYHYAQMLRYYGGMPWIGHAYKPDDDFLFERMSVAETVDKILQLTGEAAQVLPWNTSAADAGRMTAAAALGLNARVLLFVASPLFNSAQPFLSGEASSAHYTWYGDYQVSRWQAALDAGLNFLRENNKNGNFYHLVNTGNPREDFVSGYFNRHTGETLISSHRWALCTSEKAIQQIKFGISNPTGNYADMFEWRDGAPFDWNNPIHKANPFFDQDGKPTRDIRMYETLMVNGDKFQGRPLEGYTGGREGWNSIAPNFQKNAYNGYGMRKFQRDLASERNGKPYQCPLLRMPELYLSIAEAMNELGKAAVKDEFGRDAYDYVNLVRNRAGMPSLDQSIVVGQEHLREAILHERAIEFGFEEVRFFDINRWKRYDLLNVNYHRLETTKTVSGEFTYEFKPLSRSRTWIERWEDKYYLVPLPQAEINKKYGLVQNPGW
ncbi:RagB/SusD family nutrient uptake outer membrane protein [Sphingobacterium lumbrici]|uniref:RagB/SusD family nutrient uptake outer membrane protein n=1 Tax=Sphingobacterium lumbrici TaxID=2559600 RepID=UPI001C0FB69E|nr:RagB/SusD family nutrient uptake outer membrane protein [Sphingobacterium lumbrici]